MSFEPAEFDQDNWLVKWRAENGKSVRDVMDIFGVSSKTVYRWMHGEPVDGSKMPIISLMLGKPIHEILAKQFDPTK